MDASPLLSQDKPHIAGRAADEQLQAGTVDAPIVRRYRAAMGRASGGLCVVAATAAFILTVAAVIWPGPELGWSTQQLKDANAASVVLWLPASDPVRSIAKDLQLSGSNQQLSAGVKETQMRHPESHAKVNEGIPASGSELPATVPTCEQKDTSCRAKACKQLHGKPREIPLQQLGFPLHMNSPTNDRIGFSDVFVDRSSAGKLSSMAALLPVSAKVLKGKIKFKSCAIVGSSGNLLMAEYGKEIDAHSAVFRINRAPTEAYAVHTGNRTNFRLLNAKWTARYAAGASLTMEKDVVLVASRGSQLTRNFATLTKALKRSRPDVQATLLQHSALYRTGLLLSAFMRCAQAGGKRLQGGTVPSSGLVLIYNLKDICGRTSVYGFGRDKVHGRKPKYQYFAGGRLRGNPTHNFAAELDLIYALARGGYIRFCNGAVCIGSGSNKT